MPLLATDHVLHHDCHSYNGAKCTKRKDCESIHNGEQRLTEGESKFYCIGHQFVTADSKLIQQNYDMLLSLLFVMGNFLYRQS